MAKIILAVAAILALAVTGTVGVAYYNDPTLFDGGSSSSIGCPFSSGSCCDNPATDCPQAECGEEAAAGSCCNK